VPVVGLAGGIGSGKSHVAARLAARGALVSDSDAAARALLREPAIGAVLTGWWGRGILGPDDLPDRARIAAVVFADPTQRKRLEDLIHPLLHAQRDAALRAAAAADRPPPLFVIDAPLLFEAGLDRACDAVIFVDAPRATRLQRVRMGRGWTEAEFDRREASQIPVEQKKGRSTFIVDNGGDPGEPGTGLHADRLSAQIDALWPRLLALPQRRA